MNSSGHPAPHVLFTPPPHLLTSLRRLGFALGLALLGLVLTTAPCARAQVAGPMEVYPQNSSIEVGSTRQFSAYVPISPNTITWFVNDIPGGNTTVGTISATGLYAAPAVAPAANTVTVKARSTAYPTSFASTPLKITRKYPWLWSVNPSSPKLGTTQISFNGSGFASDSVATVNGVDLPTTYVSPTKITASFTATQTGSVIFAVRQPAPGAVTGNTVTAQVTAPAVTVALSPTSASVALGATRSFSATVTGHANTAVTWSVNGLAGGSSTVGTISSAGLYTAPTALPSPATVTVRATSVGAPSASGTATVTLTAPAVTVAVSPGSSSLALGYQQPFTATVTGHANTAVTWSVNGLAGGSSTLGTISSAGLYTAPATLPSPATVTVRATSVGAPSASGSASVTLTAPAVPAVTPARLAAARFLEQSSFGPTPATLAAVQTLGFNAYLDQQFALPETPVPDIAGNSMGGLRQWALATYATAPDQLRQRVAYSLGQITVTSANKLIYADEMTPWLRILSKNAFGNYRTLLRDLTLSPSMGKFLDLANSQKPGSAGGANENYPRELLQLFSIGLWMLNPDGSYATNSLGERIPTYSQETVRQVALALTGWTYATAPGATPQNQNWEYFGAPMEPRPQRHDSTAKSFLGCSLPAGQSVEQDLEAVLDCLLQHPNTAPFVATRLIRSLVLSNPSPEYIQRVATVFADNGQGVRGDLQAVVRAILLDPEARQDQATLNQGRLREPILHLTTLVRALNGSISTSQQISYLFDYMGQGILTPPSVFNWFSPLYRVPQNPQLFGPEFQIYSPTEATLRGNLFHSVLTYPGADLSIDLTPFQPYGNDMASLVEMANTVLLHGRMPAAMKQILVTAATPGYDAKTRIETVLYLTVLSGQFAVQH